MRKYLLCHGTYWQSSRWRSFIFQTACIKRNLLTFANESRSGHFLSISANHEHDRRCPDNKVSIRPRSIFAPPSDWRRPETPFDPLAKSSSQISRNGRDHMASDVSEQVFEEIRLVQERNAVLLKRRKFLEQRTGSTAR
jgi:hypothetical protein